MAIPVTLEAFADPSLREAWRREKGMSVLKLWSDAHRRTPVDVFIYEPFDFEAEYAAAMHAALLGTVTAPIVSYDSLLAMKRIAGRPRDLTDIEDLERSQRLRKEGLL